MDLKVVEPCLHGLLIRLPESFEKDDALVRISAFHLYGKLCRLLKELNKGTEILNEHISYSLMSILLHCFDNNSTVSKSALESLGEISRVLESNKWIFILESFSDGSFNCAIELLDKIENLIWEIINILCNEFSEKTDVYLACL
jgi:hypothetical protein